jgi:lia operon protein LiaG
MEKFNIKKLVLGLFAVMLIAYGIGAVIMFTSPRSFFSGEKSNFDINHTKTASLNGIKEIQINVSSSSINIIPTTDSELKAHLNGNVMSMSTYAKPDLECYSSGNTLYVNVKNKGGVTFGFFSSSLKLDIYFPTAYANELKLASSSGSINIRDLKLSKLECSASSGSTTLENITSDSFDYSSSSGNLNASGLKTKTSKLSSSSGSKRVSGFTGDLKATSSSGSSAIEYSTFNNNIDITASSGNVEVKLPEEAEFYLDANVSSGSIRSDFPITVKGSNDKHELKGTVGSDKNKIKINTSSGSIRITK